MNTELIFANVSKHIHLSDQERRYFHDLLETRDFKKNEFILRTSKACKYIYFVNSGTLRAFYVNPDGKESTIMFAIQDWWITDMHCFLNELPAMVNIQAKEQSNVLSLSKKDMDDLLENIPSFNKFFRILMQNAYCREQLRMIQNLSLPSKTRYNNFLSQYPQIASKVPINHIASYLLIIQSLIAAALVLTLTIL